jgi:hypothetical protein
MQFSEAGFLDGAFLLSIDEGWASPCAGSS